MFTRYEDGIPETIVKTRNTNCQDCPLKSKCTKAKHGRIMEINLTYEAQKSKEQIKER
ncbi:MAG: transposase [[Clostridium] innocuum]